MGIVLQHCTAAVISQLARLMCRSVRREPITSFSVTSSRSLRSRSSQIFLSRIYHHSRQPFVLCGSCQCLRPCLLARCARSFPRATHCDCVRGPQFSTHLGKEILKEAFLLEGIWIPVSGSSTIS